MPPRRVCICPNSLRPSVVAGVRDLCRSSADATLGEEGFVVLRKAAVGHHVAEFVGKIHGLDAFDTFTHSRLRLSCPAGNQRSVLPSGKNSSLPNSTWLPALPRTITSMSGSWALSFVRIVDCERR